MNKKTKQSTRERRHARVRAKISGTMEKPRMSVFRSLSHIYVQLIDDINGIVIVSADDREIKGKQNKTEKAFEVGKLIAKKAQEKKIEKISFDRGGYKYHGRVKSLADGAREGGLKF